jgi:hypothetical protein
MGRLFKNIGFAVLLLVAVLILVNIFVIMPLMRLKPEATAYIQEETVESIEPEAAVITTDTLTIIKQTGGDEVGVHIDSENKSSRNPFFWPGEKLQQKSVTKATPEGTPPEAKPEPEKPLLSMVIIGEGRKQALLDNVFVREGEMFHGYQVKRIADNKVILSDDLGELDIYLGSVDKTDEQGQPTAGLIER